MFKKLYKKLFDYDIVGEYLDRIEGNHYKVKYIKKYYLRCMKNRRKRKRRKKEGVAGWKRK